MIAYATSDGSARAGEDYIAKNGTLTATPGTPGSIFVVTKSDDLFEGAEEFRLTLRLVNAPDNVALAQRSVTGTINDDDDLTVSVEKQQETVVEGSVATFLLKLAKTADLNEAGASSDPVVVNYTLAGEVEEDDFQEAASGTLMIPAGEPMGTITVTTIADDVLERDEDLTVTIDEATTGGRSVTVPLNGGSTTMTTVGDQGRKVTISVDDISVDEGDEAVFTVSLSRSVSAAVNLTCDITGVEAADYTIPESDAVEIAANMMTAKFTVQTLPDDFVEGPEALKVELMGPPLIGVGFSKKNGTATIRDADSLEVSIEGPVTVPEGSPAVYTVKLDGGTSTASVVVDYDLGGMAVVGVDYTGEARRSFTIPSGEPMDTFSIETQAVANDDADETLVVTLTNASTEKGTVTVLTPRAVTTNFTPEDTVTVSVAADQATVAEDGGGTFTFTVTLTGGDHSAGLVVNYTLGGAATADDYAEEASGTLTFNADERIKTVTLNAEDDNFSEDDETVMITLALSGQVGDVSIGTPIATTKITDNDTLTANVAKNEDSVAEGADATFTVTLSEATSTADVLVRYKVEGDVTSADFTAPSGPLTIPAGTSTGLITVSTTDDSLPETAEDLTLTLTGATTSAGKVMLGTTTTTTETRTTEIIASDGEILVHLRDAGTVDEGGEAVFVVELSGTVSVDLTVAFEAIAAATPTAPEADEADYEPDTPVSRMIKAGQRTAMVTVSIVEDNSAENNETFKVEIKDNQSLMDADVGIGDGEGTATIRDDDQLTVNLSGPKSVTVNTQATYAVELRGGTPSADVLVTYQEGTTRGTARITEPNTRATFEITADGVVGSNVVVNLTDVSTTAGRVTRGTSRASTKITALGVTTMNVHVIDSNDLEHSTVDIAEGDTQTFTVTREGSSYTENVVVQYSTAAGSAGSSDFKAKSERLTFTNTSTSSQTFEVQTELDTQAEDDETFTVNLALVSPRDGVELGDDRVTATIADDDDLQASVTRQQITVLEGSDATFVVALTTTQIGGGSGSGSRAVVVSYTVVVSEGVTTADYTSPSSGRITIPAGQSSGTIVIPTKADDVLELGGEMLAVRLTSRSTAAGGFAQQTLPTSQQTTIRDREGTVVVSVADAAPVFEGGAAVFQVSLSGKVSQDVVVTPTTDPQNSDDFESPQPPSLTIPAGETTGTFTVQTTDDADDRRTEDEETFSLEIGLSGTVTGVVLGRATATGTIRDNDPLRANLSGPRAVATNASHADYTVDLTGGTGSEIVTVRYTYRIGNSSGSSSLTILAGIRSDVIRIANDTLPDPDSRDLFDSGSTLTVTLTEVSTDAGTVTVGSSSASTMTAATVISVADTSTTSAAEGSILTFQVRLDGDLSNTKTVRYETVAGTAAANSDYTARSGVHTFVGGSEPETIATVRLEDDELNEAEESFTLRLSQATPAGVIGTPSTTGTITDNDALTARVDPGETRVAEGSVATFVVTLDPSTKTSSAPVIIDYEVVGGAGKATEEDGDFRPPSGKLTIPAGARSGTISIQILDDGVLDRGEELEVMLTGASSAGTVEPSRMKDEDMEDEDSAMTPIADASDGVTVTVKDTTVDEGETAMFTVELSGPVSADVIVEYTIAGATGVTGATAADICPPTTLGANQDFCDEGSPLTITKGETTGTIEVKTYDDDVAEASEKFTVTLVDPLVDPVPAGVSFGDKTATATITDDALTATVVGPGTVKEGSPAEYTVTVTGGAGDQDVIVTYTTAESTATAGEDFSPAGDTVTIPADEMMATFTIRILEDDEVDLGETLQLSVEAETADGEMVRATPPAPTTILDGGSVQVLIEADPRVVAEGDAATFTVTLSGTVSNADVTLPYTIGAARDTATVDDYTPPPNQTVVIPAGEMSATISVALRADGDVEPDEDLSVRLQGDQLPEGVAIATGTARVRITDYALTASVTGPASVKERESATFMVELTGGDNRSDAVVHYTWTAGTAQAPGDFDAPTGTLTILEGQTSGTITIVAKADGVLDPSETLVLTLTDDTSALGTGLVVVDPTAGAASTTIADEGSVTWSVAINSVEEGDPVIFTVTLSALVQDDVTLTYSTRDGTAMADDDYTAVLNGTVTVTGGSREATFTVATEDDSAGEATETFTVQLRLSSAPAGVEPPSGTATATITDDDIRLVPVSPVTITEGETRPITLTLEQALRTDVKVRYTLGSGTTAEEEDFSIIGLPAGVTPDAQGALTLPVDFLSGDITVLAVDDSLAESTEVLVLLLLTVPPSGQQAATLGTIQITIEDNDELSASVTVPEAVAEGEVAPFKVTLRGGESTAPVVVSYTVGGTAKAPGDYTAPSGSLTIQSGESSGRISIQTNTDNEIEADETLVVTLTAVQTDNGTARVGSPRSATTAIQDEAFHSLNRVNQTLLPGVVRASAASALEAVSWRMAEAAQGDPPASADLAGLTGLYRALLANERALQDGSYELAKVLGGSSFLVPLSSHDGDSDSQVGIAVWGGGDFRTIGGGDVDTVDWDGSVWSARLGADMRFVDSLLTGIAVSWASGALDYVDATPRDDREGTYATWLVSAHPYVGWTSPDFGLWASGGFGYGGVTLDDSEEDAQEADLTQWSVGAGGSVTLLSTDWFIAGGTTAVKLKAEGFLAGATVAENESKVIQELTVGVNQARAAIEASHAQHFAGGGSLRPSLEIGGRFDGGDGETGAGMEVGGGLTYADPGSGLTVAATGRALVVRDGNYGEWGLSGLIQLDPNAAGHGLMMSVRPTFGVTASGVSGLWEHGTLDLLSGGEAAGGRVEAEIGYGLAAFGTAGVLTPYAGASLTDAGAHSLSLGGRLELGPAFDLTLELERSDSADPETAAEHDLTLEGTFSW